MPGFDDERQKNALERDKLNEEKKRKAMQYFVYLYMEKVKAVEIKEMRNHAENMVDTFTNYVMPEPKKQLFKDIEEARRMVTKAAFARKRVNDYFTIENEPDAPEIRETLSELDMNEDSFALTALAATGERISDFVDFFSKSEKETEPARIADLDTIRNKAILEAKEALFAYRKKDPKKFASLLGNAIKNSCEAFNEEKHKNHDVAMQWSMYVEEMLATVNKDPELLKQSGLNDVQLAIAGEVACMGSYIREGLIAIERMDQASRVEDKVITEEENTANIDAVLKMQVMISGKDDILKDWEIVTEKDVEMLRQQEETLDSLGYEPQPESKKKSPTQSEIELRIEAEARNKGIFNSSPKPGLGLKTESNTEPEPPVLENEDIPVIKAPVASMDGPVLHN